MILNAQKQLILDNQGLVYYRIRSLNMTFRDSSEYEDYVSVGMIGLIKAAINFDASRNIVFSTCALKYIDNEIFMYYRKNKKYLKNISIYEAILPQAEDDDLALIDELVDTGRDFTEKLVEKNYFVSIINIVLNNFNEKERLVTLYNLGEMTQEEIGKRIGVTQSWISALEKKIEKKIKRIDSTQVRPVAKFLFEAENDDEYKISFLCLESSNKKEEFWEYLKSLTLSGKGLNIEFYENCITIKNIRLEPETFSLIGQIIQKKQKLKI